MRRLPQTPSQTVGPFFAVAFGSPGENVLAGEGTPGTRIRIEGTVLDGDRNPIEDALIELWQANSHGRYRYPADDRDLPLDDGFTGFGRAGSGPGTRAYWFETVKLGRVPDPEGELPAPHISLIVTARGMLNHVTPRVYFEDEESNETDWVLWQVPADRRQTLIARRPEGGEGTTYRFDIRFQGKDETVFDI
jgi:protocatechuate 3,4-dioxygenase alpha subunit